LFGKIITAVNAHVTASILLGGQERSPKQIVAAFTAVLQANTAMDAAKLAYQQKLEAQRAALAVALSIEEQLKAYMQGTYGKSNALLADFGFSPAKPPVKSAQVKADAAVKSAATRVARNTMGPKQKASIHGSVSSPEPAAPAPAVTPLVTK
jgi:hypothetical protein